MKPWLNIIVLIVLAGGLRADETFARTVQPFLNTYCVSCHGSDKQKGKIRVDQLKSTPGNREEAELWARMLEAMAFGEMPSDSAEKFPTKAKARAVQDWIGGMLAQAGRTVEDKRDKEGYGNLVPHELLFSPTEKRRTVDAAARLWRISPKALANLLRGARMVSNPFAFEKPHGNFRDFKGKYAFNSLMAEQVTELALAQSLQEARNARKKIVEERKKGVPIDEANTAAVRQRYQTVLRREPADAELASLMALVKKVDAELGLPRGLQAAFAAIILQPETLFRFEAVATDPETNGLVPLSVSYTHLTLPTKA